MTNFDDEYNPVDVIYEYFEKLADGNGFNSLEEFYGLGAPRRPADEYLWKLTSKIGRPKYEFTEGELNELNEQNRIIQDSTYPQDLKNAVSELLRRETEVLRRINVRKQAKNLVGGKRARHRKTRRKLKKRAITMKYFKK